MFQVKGQGHEVKNIDFHIFNDNSKSFYSIFIKQKLKCLVWTRIDAYCWAKRYLECQGQS